MTVSGFDDRKQQSLAPTAPSTPAVDGLPRRKFCRAEIEAMVHSGILEENERFELIGGELVAMNPKGIRHERMKLSLVEHWYSHRPDNIRLAQETTFWLDEHDFVEPDILLFPSDVKLEEIAGENVLLAVEIADRSWAYDTGLKMRIYAHFGVCELWVIDVNEMIVRVHLEPEEGGYRKVSDRAAGETLRPRFAPGFPLRLKDLDL